MAGICSTISCQTSRLRSWNATSIPANWLSMTLKSSALSFSHRCTSCTVQPCQPQLLHDAHAMSATDKPIFLRPHAAAAQAEALAADLWPLCTPLDKCLHGICLRSLEKGGADTEQQWCCVKPADCNKSVLTARPRGFKCPADSHTLRLRSMTLSYSAWAASRAASRAATSDCRLCTRRVFPLSPPKTCSA